jgi:hypothetical protein
MIQALLVGKIGLGDSNLGEVSILGDIPMLENVPKLPETRAGGFCIVVTFCEPRLHPSL